MTFAKHEATCWQLLLIEFSNLFFLFPLAVAITQAGGDKDRIVLAILITFAMVTSMWYHYVNATIQPPLPPAIFTSDPGELFFGRVDITCALALVIYVLYLAIINDAPMGYYLALIPIFFVYMLGRFAEVNRTAYIIIHALWHLGGNVFLAILELKHII
jgi:phosphotransferase system  glucose/maltose/N-acetylglucosamine-specific IIC component